jgi:hypothetical protein
MLSTIYQHCHRSVSQCLFGRKSVWLRVVQLGLVPFVMWGGASLAHNQLPVETDSPCAQQLVHKDTVIPAGIMQCRAVMAIYVDSKGRFMYLENIHNDPRRLIQTIPAFDPNAGGCAGGMQCVVCITPTRCGCVC